MASVSSLDQDMRSLRLSRYTPQAANDARAWIEETLGESLPSGDLLDALKDGVALCKLAHLAIPSPGIKFKASKMPFIQMENISHFLAACEMPPLNLPAHDRFLTVDLFEKKDGAQVLQCLGAFSRQAHAINPEVFKKTIGPKKASTLVKHDSTSSTTGNRSSYTGSPFRPGSPTKSAFGSIAGRPGSPVASGRSESPTRSPGPPVSSWSKRGDESITAPAWNIHQYGYMGGASQGNQGVVFGSRRQITDQAPSVPSLYEKERLRKEKALEEERQRQEAEEAERQRLGAEEAKAQRAEEVRWEEETRRLRELERRRLEDQKREWEEQERKWNAEEEVRQKDDAELQALQKRALSGANGDSSQTMDGSSTNGSSESGRVRELEKQLAEARQREREYQAEREERLNRVSRPGTSQEEIRPTTKDSEASFIQDEREHVQPQASTQPFQRPLPEPVTKPPAAAAQRDDSTSNASLFLPQTRAPTRIDQFLASNETPAPAKPRVSSARETGDSSLEQSQMRDARVASQTQTKAGGFAGKSLLEREMERERERQREWEANQESHKSAPRNPKEGTGVGQSWDVNQYGYLDGDNQNHGNSAGSGIDIGGRRQIMGPREMKRKT